MKIVVIGGTGLIGSRLVASLQRLGHQAVAAAPNTGVNTITGEGLAEALTGAQVVVDVAKKSVPPDAGSRVSFVQGNAHDPEMLGYVMRKAEACGGNTVVALCTDDDAANLRAAFALRRSLPSGVVLLARLFRHPPDDVAAVLESSGIRCFELEDLLAERMAEVLA